MSSPELPEELTFSLNGGSFPPHGAIISTDHGPYVVVTNWVMMCLMALSVMARVGTRRNLNRDSIAILIATVCVFLYLPLLHAMF